MPLDGAQADDQANAAEQQAQAAPQLTIDAVREKYPQYHDLSDEQLAQGLHKKFYSDMPFDQFAGKIGFQPKKDLPPPTAGVASMDPNGVDLTAGSGAGPALGRIAGAATTGAMEGYGEAAPLLSDKAQAKLDDIQRQGGWKGTAAQLASTLGTDIGTVMHLPAGLFGAGMGAYQAGVRQAGEETGHPAIGEAAAGVPQALMEAFPQESMGLHGVLQPGPAMGASLRGMAERHAGTPGSPEAIQQDVQNARQTAAGARQQRVEPTFGPANQPGGATEPGPGAAATPPPGANQAPAAPEKGLVTPAPPPMITPEQRAIQEEQQEAQPQGPGTAATAPPAAPPAGPPPATATKPTPEPPPTPAQRNPASDFVMMSPDQLKVDPDRFQYKASDEKGVTGALQGVTKWEPALANPVTAWQSADGDTFVVNGHQRHDLAIRAQAAGQPDVQMPARVFREEDGYTPEFMKALGAYQNIAEGSGTPVDAAKVLRAKDAIPTEVVLPELPPKSQMVIQARSLAKLSPDAFGIVENGIVPPAYAAHVGDLIADPKQQEAALGLLARAEPANTNQARLMVQDIRNSGFLQGTQQGLFGDEDFAKSVFPERMKVLDGAMASLRRTRGLFKAAVEGEEQLTAAGNKLETESNVKARTTNDQIIDILQRDATTRGPISDALTNAANDLASGKPRPTVQAAFLSAVRKIIERGEDQGIQPRDLYGGEGSPEPARPVAPPAWRAANPDIPEDIYRGSGREDRGSAYNPLTGGAEAPAVLGNARYSAFDPKEAERYGPNVEAAKVGLQNPLVIRSDTQWRALAKEAGWEFPNLTGMPLAEIKAATARMKQIVLGKGHDGVVVFWTESKYDIDGKTGAPIKLLRNVFDTPQVADYRPEAIQAGLGLEQPRRLPIPPRAGQDMFGDLIPEKPARAAPEPTIRNDQRQQAMPGMEPSAIQAQAARNAQGPRGNQLPPDHGLFARPETPQPGLPMERPTSRLLSENPNTRDLLHDFPNPEGGHEAAKAWVLERGKATGHEHAAIVDERTGRVVHATTDGQPNRVGFSLYGGDDAPPDTYTVHHNHPSGSGLSGPDLGLLSWPAIKEIIAHGHGGDSYVMSAGDKLRPYRPERSSGYQAMSTGLKRAFDATAEIAVSHLSKMLDELGWKGWDTARAQNEAVNLTSHLLHGQGIINYSTTRPLSEPITSAVHPTRLRYNDRPAGTLQSGTGAGELHPPAGAGAGQEPPGRPVGDTAREEEPRAIQAEAGAQAPLNIPPTPQFDVLRDKTGIERITSEIKAWLSPTSLLGSAKQERVMRKYGAEKAQSLAQSTANLEKVRNAIDVLPQAAQDDFTDRMERGLPQATPVLDRVATAIRKELDDWASHVQGLGKGYLSAAIDDYMGHVYANYPEWKAAQKGLLTNPQTTLSPKDIRDRVQATAQAKTPLLGSGNFLKQRTFPTLKDAMAAGLQPITHNPIDMQLIKMREMQKFYHGDRLADTMKSSGMATWVPAGQERMAEGEGYVKLDDKVFQPRLMGASNPAGFGRLEPGNYYAPEPAARLFNRYMATSLVNQSHIINGMRQLGNGLNMLQLGLSFFHATFVAMDTIKSNVALSLRQMARGIGTGDAGTFGKGAFNFATGIVPGANLYHLVDTVNAGRKLNNAWLDPSNATPEWQQLAKMLNEGGGRGSMDRHFGASGEGPLVKHAADLLNPKVILGRAMQGFADEPSVVKKATLVPLQLAGRVIESLSHPLMGSLVPRAKMGVFAKMAQDWQEAHMNATPEERSAAMIKAWDSVENRLGLMTYDNLFWNKTQKDIAFLMTRSVGWNVGTVRELGGAAVDSVKAVNNIAQGRAPEFTHRMAYPIAMAAVTAGYGALINYLSTGQAPQSAMDYFFPRTGKMTPQGKPERRNIPGYEKDVIEYSQAPGQTMLNKTNPLPETAIELYNNKDYYGGIIRDPQRDAAVPTYMDYLFNQAMPFSWRGYQRLQAEKSSRADQALAFFGFQPASKAISQPEVGEAFQKKENVKEYRRRAREEGRMAPFSSLWGSVSGHH